MVNNKLSSLFPKFVQDVLEEGRKKLGPQSRLIPFPDFRVMDLGNDYVPVIIDGEGNEYLWVKKGEYYKRGRLFGYKNVTNNLKEEVSRIYLSETRVSIPSKIAKFCGNIGKIIGATLDDVYKLGQKQFWDIPEVSFFDQRKPWPYEYKLVNGNWKLVEKKFSKNIHVNPSLFWDLSRLKDCKDYPKFVIDYITKVQPLLKRGDSLCTWCFPVVPMKGRESLLTGKFFVDGINVPNITVPLVYKSGKWYDQSLILKRLTKISDPAQYLLDYILPEITDVDRKENDYKEFMDAIRELQGMVGKYRV